MVTVVAGDGGGGGNSSEMPNLFLTKAAFMWYNSRFVLKSVNAGTAMATLAKNRWMRDEPIQ